jgi:hypothetical protein
MEWTAGEIAGFIGAAAWVPHVGRWLYAHLAKPRVTVLTGAVAEVGYTSFGPILNLRLNLSCDRRDVVINRIRIRLIHESGDQRIFGWQGTRETFSQLKDASGTAVGTFERDSEATAVKVTTHSVYESFFRFQELKFIETKEPLFNAVVEHESYLRASGQDAHDEILGSEPMHKLKAFHRDAFWWQGGTYTAQFEIDALSEITIVRKRYSFMLTTVDVDALRKNIDTIPESYEHALKKGTEGFDKAEPMWRWRNPTIHAL